MMTNEERLELELECANAKVRCKEAWDVLAQLAHIAQTYFDIHDKWKGRYEKADRKLAEEYRLVKVSEKKKKQQEPTITKEDVMELLKEIEEEGGE